MSSVKKEISKVTKEECIAEALAKLGWTLDIEDAFDEGGYYQIFWAYKNGQKVGIGNSAENLSKILETIRRECH